MLRLLLDQHIFTGHRVRLTNDWSCFFWAKERQIISFSHNDNTSQDTTLAPAAGSAVCEIDGWKSENCLTARLRRKIVRSAAASRCNAHSKKA